MTPEEILDVPACALTQAQRESYLEQGCLVVEGAVDDNRLSSLRRAVAELEERARVPEDCPSDFEFESCEDNSTFQLRQLLCSADHHPVFWSFASGPPMTDIVADVVGPNVEYMQSNVTFKRPGGRGFPWHQDIALIPHSNLSPLMAFIFLEDVTEEMGPTRMIPGSHRGERFDHYDEHGNWTGVISDQDIERLPLDEAVTATGPAGTVLLCNCATVHSAAPNRGTRPRPMVITGYVSPDTHCYVDLHALFASQYIGRVVRGESTKDIHSETFRMRMPPDWRDYQGVRIDDLEHQHAGATARTGAAGC